MKLKEFRKANGITQVQLAELMGVGQSTICGWEDVYKRQVPDPAGGHCAPALCPVTQYGTQLIVSPEI